jgi:Ribonuclease G/E
MLIAVSVRDTIARIALLDDDRLTEFYLWNFAAPDGIGDLYTARITARAPAMAGSFVDLGSDTTGFLPDSAGAKTLTEGAYLTVRVARSAQSGKGLRLAAASAPPADRPGLIQRGPGPLAELAARFPDSPIQVDDYALIAKLAALKTRITHKSDAFDPVLEDEVAALVEPIAPLPHGAAMHVGFTKALTAIDIDSGAASQSALALNQAIIPEICRQIVLRNLSGGILIDFAGMKSTARPKLEAPLRAALARDPLKPRLLGFTNLGYAEIARPRIRPPLHEVSQP